MALTPRLDLRQSQQLVMTPQLQQAIKLLQLSNLELADYVSEEIERNPILEIGEAEPTLPIEAGQGEGGGTATDENLSDPASSQEGAGLITADQPFESGFDTGGTADAALDTTLEQTDYHHDTPSDSGRDNMAVNSLSSAGRSPYDGDLPGLDQTLESVEDFGEFLRQQMAIAISDPVERLIASYLIDLVDEAGYIQSDAVDELGERLSVDSATSEHILRILQGLEPTGVFARSLQECLALQLKELNRYDPAMAALLENLDLLAKRDLTALKRRCRVDDEDLNEMISEIRALNPKPGLAYSQGETAPVVPDIFIHKNRTGIWTVELNNDTLPKVLVNNQYLTELSLATTGAETKAKAFISECQTNANWLVKALDQRARTILKVSTALIKAQEQFFEHGVRFLKPMTLKDIADEIDMHESTVSRVTNNKYLSCSRGLFELKYFFTSAINSSLGGDALSAQSVKYRLKELVDREDPKKILSDDKLVKLMKAEGIEIARRTVAKYRDALRIPSSVERRRIKNMVQSHS